MAARMRNTGNVLVNIDSCFVVPRSAEARVHASLGYVYELLQDVDKAIDHYEQVSKSKQPFVPV